MFPDHFRAKSEACVASRIAKGAGDLGHGPRSPAGIAKLIRTDSPAGPEPVTHVTALI